MKIVEIRANRLAYTPLTRAEAMELPAWMRYGWNGETPLQASLGLQIIETRRASGEIDRYGIKEAFAWDSGSVPDLVPDKIANDYGWHGQQLMFKKHDVDYLTHYLSRKQSDADLLSGNLLVGTDPGESCRIWAGVRIGGGRFGKYLSFLPGLDSVEGPSRWHKPDWVLDAAREHISFEIVDRFALSCYDEDVVFWKAA